MDIDMVRDVISNTNKNSTDSVSRCSFTDARMSHVQLLRFPSFALVSLNA